jgi:hypothetical protein
MSRTSGPVRRFVTQVLALPVAVVVAVGALVVGGAEVASVVAVSDGTGPTPSAGQHGHAKPPGLEKAKHHGPDKAKAHGLDKPGTSVNPGLGHGCGHSAGKAKGHGVGLAHAPGQQPATCRAPGRLAGPDKPDKAGSDKGETARERAHAKAEKAREKGERD